MRIALLSAQSDAHGIGATPGERPALRRFAGKTVLTHQIDCAVHLDCERVLCITGAAGPELGAARAYAERASLRFERVETPPLLAAKVAAGDEIVLLADGLLPDCAALVEALGLRNGVIAFPAEPAVELGFERLDATRAWSGALRTRGECVARLADLPPDSDPASALLRIALQMGTPVVELDGGALEGGAWQRRVERQAAAASEWQWVTRQVRPAPFAAPGMALVERIGLRWAYDAGSGRWRRAPHALSLAAGVLALVAVLAGRPVLGLGALFAATTAFAIAGVFDRVEALGARPRQPGKALLGARLACDGLLVALLSRLVMTVPSWLGIVLPLVLMGLLHLGATNAGPRLRALFGDRIALVAALALLAYAGWTTPALAVLILAVLVALLFRGARAPAKQLTAD